MYQKFDNFLKKELEAINQAGLYKLERNIASSQSNRVAVDLKQGTRKTVINLCSNNYLGLANDKRLIAAAKHGLESGGYGMASVRFICGTQAAHRQLEKRIAEFLGKDDAILYAACFDANGGLFEPLLNEKDAIISDALNHASIIDGIRLCKAKRYRYANSDMDELESRLREARQDGARHLMIATDGVFSMDGYIAKLDDICGIAERYEALVMVDDCHAVGVLGKRGAGTPAYFNLTKKIDIITGTLGKALGGAIGGYTAASQPVIDMLRQRSRPYLFSNSLPPAIVAAGLTAIDIVEQDEDLRKKIIENAKYWRSGLEQIGFSLLKGEHPIIPVMLGEADLAQKMARELFHHGVYASGFFYPVVPNGKARIRTQMSAGLMRSDLDEALDIFETAGKLVGAI